MDRGRIVFCTGLIAIAAATGVGFAHSRAGRARLTREVQTGIAHLEEQRRAHEGEAEATRAAARQLEAARLTEEIAALRNALTVQTISALPSAPATQPRAPQGSSVPANPWPNAGRREPLAAFQTAQWAIHEGDLDALEGLLAFDDGSIAAAQDFYDRLDAESKKEFRSPERLIAAAIAAKSRTGIEMADVVTAVRTPEGALTARVRISGPRVTAREITLRFRQDDDGWRLYVPANVVTGYRNLLLGPEVDPYTQEFIR